MRPTLRAVALFAAGIPLALALVLIEACHFFEPFRSFSATGRLLLGRLAHSGFVLLGALDGFGGHEVVVVSVGLDDCDDRRCDRESKDCSDTSE